MEYKNFDCGPFNLHMIKTNKFKTVHMEIIFRNQITKESMQKRTLLSDILTSCSKIYPTERDLLIHTEELYKPIIYGTTSKTGDIFNTIFICDFIASEYINDPDYYRKVLELPLELIMNPYVCNREFDLKIFNIAKERLKSDLESINDNPIKKSIRGALELGFANKATSYPVLGTIEELEQLTPTILYDEYISMLDHDYCDIFLIGNIPEYETESIIKNKFSLRTIKNHEIQMYIDQSIRKKVLMKADPSDFVQSSVEIVFNVLDLTELEKNITFHIFNYIFGSGGITSKLYQLVREKESMCYSISSMYLKYDRLLIVQVSLDESNVSKVIKLVKKALKEMVDGKFSNEDIDNAKTSIIHALEMADDNPVSILNNYVFELFDKLPNVTKRVEQIKTITKSDLIKVAKKVKLNLIYDLKGGENGKN